MGIYLIEVRHKTIRKKAIQQTEKITEQRPNIKKIQILQKLRNKFNAVSLKIPTGS